MRNSSAQAISPFLTVFYKYIHCRHVKTTALGKGYKGENAGSLHKFSRAIVPRVVETNDWLVNGSHLTHYQTKL